VVRWSEVDGLLGVALACFLLSYVESVSVVRTFGLKHGYPVDADQELLATGVANIAVGMTQGYPVAAGMSQSAVNEKAGAKTQMALLVASASIAGVLLFLTGLMRNLPSPVLAAVVLFAVSGLIKPHELRHLYRVSRSEFKIAMVATAGVLLFGILKGVLLAAIFSILLLLKRASHPRIAHLGYLSATDRFVDKSRYPESQNVSHALVLRVEAGLFYFNAQNVRNEIIQAFRQEKDTQLVVIDMSTSANIDLAGVRMIGELSKELRSSGVCLKLAQVHGSVRDLLQAEGLERDIQGIEHRLRISTLIDSWKQALRQTA
jgi:anti-anti-sigma factor